VFPDTYTQVGDTIVVPIHLDCQSNAALSTILPIRFRVISAESYNKQYLEGQINAAVDIVRGMLAADEVEELLMQSQPAERQAFNAFIVAITWVPAAKLVPGVGKFLLSGRNIAKANAAFRRGLSVQKAWKLAGKNADAMKLLSEKTLLAQLPEIYGIGLERIKTLEKLLASAEHPSFKELRLAYPEIFAGVPDPLGDFGLQYVKKNVLRYIRDEITRQEGVAQPQPRPNEPVPPSSTETNLMTLPFQEKTDGGKMTWQKNENGIEVTDSPSAANGTYKEWLYDLDRSKVNQLQWTLHCKKPGKLRRGFLGTRLIPVMAACSLPASAS
jgi:hypothetical protein